MLVSKCDIISCSRLAACVWQRIRSSGLLWVCFCIWEIMFLLLFCKVANKLWPLLCCYTNKMSFKTPLQILNQFKLISTWMRSQECGNHTVILFKRLFNINSFCPFCFDYKLYFDDIRKKYATCVKGVRLHRTQNYAVVGCSRWRPPPPPPLPQYVLVMVSKFMTLDSRESTDSNFCCINSMQVFKYFDAIMKDDINDLSVHLVVRRWHNNNIPRHHHHQHTGWDRRTFRYLWLKLKWSHVFPVIMLTVQVEQSDENTKETQS